MPGSLQTNSRKCQEDHLASRPVAISISVNSTAMMKILVKHGTVVFQCDPHKAFMNGTFPVGGVGQV
jgi:hypothetical protein